MELRVTCGGSDRRVGTTSVSPGITDEGPVYVIEVQRTRVPEWFPMWYLATEAEAQANRNRAIGLEGNGGRVTAARVTEGRAYWARVGERPKRAPKSKPAQSGRQAVMGPSSLCPIHFTELPVTGRCDDCD